MNKPKFVVSGADQCWYWDLISANGIPLARSRSNYTRRRDCLRAVDTVLLAIFDADIRVMEATK